MTRASSGSPAISICVCTFRRPLGLSRLLHSLRGLDPHTPSREVIVIDNDAERSAEALVRRAIQDGLDVHYEVEPVRNIALARNRAVLCAQGDWLAFIDDDEEADPLWLLELWRSVQSSDIDAAFGVVIRRFEPTTPAWIRSVYPAQQRLPGGALRWQDTGTGNAFVRRATILSLNGLFNPYYGETGGEDAELFSRMAIRGCTLVGVPGAIVYESLPASRLTIRYLLRWWFAAGVIVANVDNAANRLSADGASSDPSLLLRRVRLTGVHVIQGGLLIPWSRERALKHLMKAAFESGTILGGRFGLRVRRPRRVSDVPLDSRL